MRGAADDPFSKRTKLSKTITVDELEKMGGDGKSRVKDIKNAADFKKALATVGGGGAAQLNFAMYPSVC